MLKPPLVDGAYPVTALIEAFGVHEIASVERTPVAEVVTTVAQAPDEIEPVPSADVPLAMVRVAGLNVSLLYEHSMAWAVESA